MAKVSGDARDPGDSLQQPENFQHARRVDRRTGHALARLSYGQHARGAEILLGQEVVLDGVENLVEADHDADLLVGEVLQCLHNDGDHRAHAARDAEAGQCLKDVLGQPDLVGEERVAVDKGSFAHGSKVAARLDVRELSDWPLLRPVERT